MPNSLIGSLEEAMELQVANNVQPSVAGIWYHVSKNETLDAFRADHPDQWIFLTRSPGGGTKWGDRLLQVVVVHPLPFHRLFPPGTAISHCPIGG